MPKYAKFVFKSGAVVEEEIAATSTFPAFQGPAASTEVTRGTLKGPSEIHFRPSELAAILIIER